MKKAVLILGFILLWSGVAFAGPFLVCDPYTTGDGIVNFKVSMDSGIYVDSVPMSNALHYDLSSLGNGAHTVKVQACNIWGCSSDSSPFAFTKAVPVVPSNTHISTQ